MLDLLLVSVHSGTEKAASHPCFEVIRVAGKRLEARRALLTEADLSSSDSFSIDYGRDS